MRVRIALLMVAAGALTAAGQNEAALRRYFEGRNVRVKIDMPGTHEGVDIRWRQDPPLDFKNYSHRVKTYGRSLAAGDAVMVTTVRVKSKNIEFQLGGGGYGTLGDDTSTVSTPYISKSSRQSQLEKDVKNERDPRRRDEMNREVGRLEDSRRREESRARAQAEALSIQKRAEIAEKRRQGGSRFNVWFPEKYLAESTPTPEQLMEILSEWIEFDRGPQQTAAKAVGLKRGMARAEVEAMLGRPAGSRRRTEGSLEVETVRWESAEEITEVDFLDGLVIKFRTSSR